MTVPTFEGFPKIARLSRRMVITEKIDGTNAQVIVPEDGSELVAASRTRLITCEDDNYGFAKWVRDNSNELRELGPGRHFGEWWGAGIQKRYGSAKQPKTFSLFNVARWTPTMFPGGTDPALMFPSSRPAPICCKVVPVLHVGEFHTAAIEAELEILKITGSVACPGAQAEGVIIFHEAANLYFKKAIERDAEYKGKS